MGTKNDPSTYDCYANAEPDEPMFVLLGRDVAAPLLVDLWAALRGLDRDADDAQLVEAKACAEAMRAWRRTRPRPTVTLNGSDVLPVTIGKGWLPVEPTP